jgi:hypothetical protein
VRSCVEAAIGLRGDELREAFLDAAMIHYFRRKLPNLDEAELLARLEEALKFLFLAPACRGAIPVTREIDDVWHLWILQTEQYVELCGRLPTGTFLHHCSNDYLAAFGADAAPRDDLTEAVRMLALRVQHFGPFEPDRVRYWRHAAHLVERCGWSLASLNDWLSGSDALNA